MDLTLFPMDSQLCTLVIESYGYTMADLVYVWNDELKSVEVPMTQPYKSQLGTFLSCLYQGQP